MTEILKNRNGKIIVEVIEATVSDDDGNACVMISGFKVQTAFVYNSENNYLDDILYRVDTLI